MLLHNLGDFIMIIKAATMLTMLDEPLSPGMVRIRGNEIVEIGQDLSLAPDEEFIDLGDAVLLPGMINAHCHLDYTNFKGSIFPGKTFTEWIKRINSIKLAFGPEDYIASIQSGFQMLIESGCTTVFNIEAFPDILMQMSAPPIRTWWFLELIDLRQRINSEQLLAGALEFFNGRPGWLGGFGISPHAPYTASVELYRLAKYCEKELKMPFTTHIAESLDEHEMFVNADGPMYAFLKELGRNMGDCGQGSPFSHLVEQAGISPTCIAVHMNYLQEYDYVLLKDTPLSIVHCPKCHDYFLHARFPLEKLRDSGCNICIGTDSLASNDTLDLRAEIRHARRHYSNISGREWLSMVTTRPAKAIGLSRKLGSIRTGAWADLVAFKLPPQTDPYEAVIRSKEPPEFMMIDGKVVLDKK